MDQTEHVGGVVTFSTCIQDVFSRDTGSPDLFPRGFSQSLKK
jgi:hypothetical protein